MISNETLQSSFYVSGSTIQFTHNRLVNGLAPIEKMFFISSSATDFYIKAIPTIVPLSSNMEPFVPYIKLFLSSSNKEITQNTPLIMKPRQSVEFREAFLSGFYAPALGGNIIVKVDIPSIYQNISYNSQTPDTINLSYNIKFKLVAGQLSSLPENPPTISSFELGNAFKEIGCGRVGVFATWVVAVQGANASNFKLRIRELGEELPVESVAQRPILSTETYEDGSGVSIQPSYTLDIVRISDNTVVASYSRTASAPVLVSSIICNQ